MVWKSGKLFQRLQEEKELTAKRRTCFGGIAVLRS